MVLALNMFFLAAPIGYLYLGQRRKAAVALAYVVVGLPLCGLVAPLVLMFAYDAYLLAQRMEAGEPVYTHDVELPTLRRLPGFRR